MVMSEGLAKYAAKIKTAEQAIAMIKSGDRVYIGNACATPRTLVHALETSRNHLEDVVLFHFITNGAFPISGSGVVTRFQHQCFFIGSDEREAVKKNQADYIPISIAQTPHLIKSGRLAATTDDGQESRIRPLLKMGEGVTIARSDVHYVITEYGCAYLFGKSIRERALALIEIAHPHFRAGLLVEAKQLGYVRLDQQLKSWSAYPIQEEREILLKNGVKLLVRPSKASDMRSLQDLFYGLSADDIYTRFFQDLRFLPVSAAEHLCNVDYESEMAFLAVVGDRENEIVVGSACYFLNPTTNLAEAAYMIHPKWQGLGLGRILQQRMIEYAQPRGLRGFTLEILTTNDKMIKLAKSGSGKVSIERSGGTYEVVMLF